MSSSQDKAVERKRRFTEIVNAYMQTCQKMDESRAKLDEICGETRALIDRYQRMQQFYSQYPYVQPSGSFAELQETSLSCLLTSACSNATIAHAHAVNLDKSVQPLLAVTMSGSSVASNIEVVTSSIAEKSHDANDAVTQWNLPTPSDNQESLEPLLHGIEPRLEADLHGAWQTLYDKGKADRFHQASSSMRELVSDVLQVLAPDPNVMKACWFEPEKEDGLPTQRQRAYYAITGKNDSIKENDLITVDELAQNIRTSYEKLNKYVHARNDTEIPDQSEVESQLIVLFNQTQIYLLDILRLRSKFFV